MAVKHGKHAMPSALPGSVTPSLLPADELQSVLRLKGASEDESTVIMAELGLQFNKRLLSHVRLHLDCPQF